MHSVAIFVEFPVKDIERAAKFYGAIFGKELEVKDDGVRKFAVIANVEDSVVGTLGASLTQVDGFEPNPNGPLPYFNAGDDIEGALKKVTDAGGKIVIGKTQMWPGAVFATFNDTEGNTLAFFGQEATE